MDKEINHTNEKCYVCKKNIKIVDQIYGTCRCGKLFCKYHRFSGMMDTETSHKCEYDYKNEGIKELQLYMPKIVPNKITKI